MKLDKMFREQYHRHRGITDRIDYVLAQDIRTGDGVWKAGSVLLSVEKAKEGGWAFLGKRFNSVQGAKKEARKYCNKKAENFSQAT